MALHPNRRWVATGQVASVLDGTAAGAYLTVWDACADPPKQMKRIDFRWGRRRRRCRGRIAQGERAPGVGGIGSAGRPPPPLVQPEASGPP